ncbi:XTP/dITP diphosphatase [Candidatus Bathyarchaeota archaeon]|nr:XTP/dITP diphosphatase [Candidatus Bathyarchaeota archaeon]MCK4435658.1 XTP/dITP diphosphatase [Candidatus Bathyarchaeota archaeon]
MTRLLKGRIALLATSNVHKFNEARRILSEHGIATAMLKNIRAVEIQDDDIENIAKARAMNAFEKCRLPIVVEDAGLFIRKLANFPGPYSSYVYKTIGNDGLLKLMENVTDRRACFRSVVAFLSPMIHTPICFNGEVEGRITEEKLGQQGFGFDPIFEPSHSSKTYGQMTVEEKNQLSHRASSFRGFAKFYKG